MKPDPPIDPLARAIAERVQVDWESAESAAPDDATRGLVRQLAVIAAIAEVHSPATNAGEEPAVAAAGAVPDMPTWGPFRLLERVGRGAYGEVYRAQDTRLNREVALKLLPADLIGERATSTIREGSLLARVRHPNVVDIHGAEQIGDRIGLWMEFVEGQTLEQILEQRISLSESEVVAIGIQVCRAVSAVHGAGLLHRDIKAQNVMRAADGRIVLLDFGAGWIVDTDSASDLAGISGTSHPKCCVASRPPLRATSTVSASCSIGSSPVRSRSVAGRSASCGSATKTGSARQLGKSDRTSRRSSPAPSTVRSTRTRANGSRPRRRSRRSSRPTRAVRESGARRSLPAPWRSSRPHSSAGELLIVVLVKVAVPARRRRTMGWRGGVHCSPVAACRAPSRRRYCTSRPSPAIPTRPPLTPGSPRLTRSCRSPTAAFHSTWPFRSCSVARLRHSHSTIPG